MAAGCQFERQDEFKERPGGTIKRISFDTRGGWIKFGGFIELFKNR
jgi:hypothetical protein